MNVEFVSVNPTGPLHVGHARYASYGDALCRIFAYVGHDVTREFYVNDYGTQMTRFAQSLAARYGQRLGLDARRARGGLPGRVPARPGRRAHRRARRAVSATRSPRRAPTCEALDADTLQALKLWGRDAILRQFRVTLGAAARPVRRLDSREHAVPGRGRAPRLLRRGGQVPGRPGRRAAPLRRGRRLLAAHHGVRRRQGPRAHPSDRRPHLLPQRHRLPPRQDGPRLRPHDRHLGGRPPRLRAAHEGRLHGPAAARPGQAGAHHRAAREPAGERRGQAHEQAQGRHRHGGRPHRRRGRGRGPVPARGALARHHARAGHRRGPRAVQQEPRVLRAVRARAHLQHPAEPAGRGGGRPAKACRPRRPGPRSAPWRAPWRATPRCCWRPPRTARRTA